MSIGKKIKDLRKLNNLTQVELAKKSNISRSYLADIEKDRYNASLDTLKAISASLNVSLSEIVDSEKKNVLPDDLKAFKFEQYLNALGYELIGDSSEGYLSLLTEDREYEITSTDLEELHSSSESYIKFKIAEITNKSRSLPNKSYLTPIAAHDRNGSFTDEDYKHDLDLMNDDSLWDK